MTSLNRTRFPQNFATIGPSEIVILSALWSILGGLLGSGIRARRFSAKVKYEVQTSSLWNHAKDLVKPFTPIYLILCLLDQGGPATDVLDGKMREARETMIKFETNNYVTELRLRNCVKLFDA